MEFLQTKPQVKNMKNNCFDLFYTVMKNRDEKEIVKDKHEYIENEYIKYEDFITPNHYIGGKNDKVMLR